MSRSIEFVNRPVPQLCAVDATQRKAGLWALTQAGGRRQCPAE